ncbi:MAG: hypothetical protein J5778_05810 [Clostridiales bacterium]|nr:hypothetical protein [Clostridiales bacterium]
MGRDHDSMLSTSRIKIVFAFVFSGIMLASLAGCGFNSSSLFSSETSFTPATDSNTIHGTPKIAGEEILLPCTISDLKNKGFETDYLYENGYVKMWHISEEKRGNNLCMYVYLDKAYDYKDNDNINDDDTVVAILVTQYDHIDLDFNGIRIWGAKEDILNIAGTPAYEKEVFLAGNYCFYLGDNDQVYRLKFLATDKLEEFLFGTKDYMIDENGQLNMGASSID